MKKEHQELMLENFQIEELEERLEMAKWTLSASSNQNWTKQEFTTSQTISVTF